MSALDTAPTPKPQPRFGPWVPGIDQAERLARTRSMRVIVMLLARPHADLIRTLQEGETSSNALEAAWHIFNSLPTLTLRRVLTTYSNAHSSTWRPR